MNEQIVMKWEDLDIDKVSFESGSNWTWGMMSQGHYRIIHLENLPNHDFQETIYPVPECIGRMLDLKEQWGKQELRREVSHFLKSKLGLNV